MRKSIIAGLTLLGLLSSFPVADAQLVFPGGGNVPLVTPCTAYTPTDQSGGTITFTATSVQYCQYGNFVYYYGNITFPLETDTTHSAKISTPVPVPNHPYAESPGSLFTGAGLSGPAAVLAVPNTSTMVFTNPTNGTAYTNANFNSSNLWFFLVYPAS